LKGTTILSLYKLFISFPKNKNNRIARVFVFISLDQFFFIFVITTAKHFILRFLR
jgi:hypothetical protein